jgi:DNA-binding MarR family transcriptional regulator
MVVRQIVRSIDMPSHHMVKTLCGLNGTQRVLMKEIAHGRMLSPSDLAQAAKLSNAAVSGILRCPKARGLASRRRGGKDRRRQLVAPTAAGWRAFDAASDTLQDRLAGRKDWDQSLLLSPLQRLAEAMSTETLDAAPLFSRGSLTIAGHQVLDLLSGHARRAQGS